MYIGSPLLLLLLLLLLLRFSFTVFYLN